MDKDAFWKLIDRSRKDAEDVHEQGERLIELLSKLPESEIRQFDSILDDLRDQAYRWDLWAVAYIIGGGCSDDGFEYFRCWLIAQGRDYFEAALADPQKAARRVEPGDEAEFEELLYCANQAYAQATGGEEMPPSPPVEPREREPTGQRWEEDNLETLYPKLWKKFA